MADSRIGMPHSDISRMDPEHSDNPSAPLARLSVEFFSTSNIVSPSMRSTIVAIKKLADIYRT